MHKCKTSKAKIAVMAGLCGALVFGGAAHASASDIDGHWNERSLQEWIDYGVLLGYENGDYGPDRPATRAQITTFLDRIMGYQYSAKNTFTDLDQNWYTDVILRGVSAGIIYGDAQGTMRPNDLVTREEAAVILARVLDLDSAGAQPGGFADANAISPWAQNSVNAMVAAGYIHGYPDGSFGPKRPITRAELIGMLDNMFTDLYQKAGTYNKDVAGSAVVAKSGTTLKDEVIKGDLVISEGVASGHVVLDGVEVKGKLIIRGGGTNSVVIKGSSNVPTVVIDRQKDEVRLAVQDAASVDKVVVGGDTASAKVDGTVGSVTVESAGATTAITGTVDTVNIAKTAKGAKVNAHSGAVIDRAAIAGANATLSVGDGALVKEVSISAANTVVTGAGTVTSVTAEKGSNAAKVETMGTTVKNNGAGTVAIPGGSVAPGETATTSKIGGVSTERELLAKLNDQSVTNIQLRSDIAMSSQLVIDRPVTITGNGKSLTFAGKDSSELSARVMIASNNVTLDDVGVKTVENTAVHAAGYGIVISGADGVTLNRVAVSGAKTGIQVNSSKVKMTGAIDISGNGFAGIEVSTSKSGQLASTSPSLDVSSATLVNRDEDFTSHPTMMIEGYDCKDTVYDSNGAPAMHPAGLSNQVITGFDTKNGICKVVHSESANGSHQLWYLVNDKPDSIAIGQDSQDGTITNMYGGFLEGGSIMVSCALDNSIVSQGYANVDWIRVALTDGNNNPLGYIHVDKENVKAYCDKYDRSDDGQINGTMAFFFNDDTAYRQFDLYFMSPVDSSYPNLENAVVMVSVDGKVHQKSFSFFSHQ